MKPAARMKNRWRLHEMQPFIRNGFRVLGVLSLILYLAAHLPRGPTGMLVYAIASAAWWAMLAYTGLLLWLYTLRPR